MLAASGLLEVAPPDGTTISRLLGDSVSLAFTGLGDIGGDFYLEIAAPEDEVRLYAVEQFAQGHKACYVLNTVRGQMVKLEPIEMEKAPEERMDWKAKTAKKKGNESYPLIVAWMRDDRSSTRTG